MEYMDIFPNTIYPNIYTYDKIHFFNITIHYFNLLFIIYIYLNIGNYFIYLLINFYSLFLNLNFGNNLIILTATSKSSRNKYQLSK